MRTAVVGASGYAGSELLRIMASHDALDVVLATGESSAGVLVKQHVPALAAVYPSLVFSPTAAVLETDLDVVFLALPHGTSQALVQSLVNKGIMVVDLGADFRFKDPLSYKTWYKADHQAPELLEKAVYALVERHRPELVGAQLLAVPGCYPTAAALALGPFFDAGVVQTSGVVVNALSGVSGAGRATNERLHFARLVANAEAYGLLDHRHTGEMEKELGASVLFTPHLVPVARGELVTAYATAKGPLSTNDAMKILHEAYDDEPFVVITDEPPTLKDPLGSNLCFVSARVDERTGWLVAMSSIDNLVKGAAGQAVQAFNVARGLDETMGLSRAGLTP
jgi:N-acetyl-gamma-glutamyl-phosphate reductase